MENQDDDNLGWNKSGWMSIWESRLDTIKKIWSWTIESHDSQGS